MDYNNRLEELLAVINKTPDIRARSQLFKLYRNCRAMYTELNREEVECRRLHKVTAKYSEIERKLNESITNFEHWVSFSALLY